MKKAVTILFSLFIAINLISCGTTAGLYSKRKAIEIDSASVFHLPSMISVIGKGNRQELNIAFSDSATNLRKANFKEAVPVSLILSEIEFINKSEENRLSESLFKLMNTVETTKKIKGITLDNTIIDFMKSKKIKYAIITISYGFTREAGNYGKQVAKSLGVGLLTLGMVVPISIKANSTIICYILDSENHDIAFYKRNTTELEPLKAKNIKFQISNIMDAYFNPTNK